MFWKVLFSKDFICLVSIVPSKAVTRKCSLKKLSCKIDRNTLVGVPLFGKVVHLILELWKKKLQHAHISFDSGTRFQNSFSIEHLLTADSLTSKLFAAFAFYRGRLYNPEMYLGSCETSKMGPFCGNRLYVTRCAFWYHLYNFKNVKNNHGGVLILVKFTKLY